MLSLFYNFCYQCLQYSNWVHIHSSCKITTHFCMRLTGPFNHRFRVCQSLTINTCKDINKKRKKKKSNELFFKENKSMLTKDQGKSSSAQQKLQAAILSAICDTAFRIWIELYLFIYCFLYLLFTVLSAPDPNDTCLFFLLWYWFYCIISLSSSSIMHSSCCW